VLMQMDYSLYLRNWNGCCRSTSCSY
jgi:hypothetical protein